MNAQLHVSGSIAEGCVPGPWGVHVLTGVRSLVFPPLSSSLGTGLGCVVTCLPEAAWDMESSVL